MENRTVRDRLSALRAFMTERKIDVYLIPTEDFHSSEYVSDYFKVREYFCGFTGSNGTLLVWQDGAGLWTDGRYFIQAQKELAGTGVTLFRMQDEGVPTIEEFLTKQMGQGQTLAFDGRVVSARLGMRYEKALAEKGVRIFYGEDPAEGIWRNRPAFPAGEVKVLEEALAGESVESKLERTLSRVEQAGADALLLTKLDDLMWLFNLRGCDVACNPVAMSYGYLEKDRAVLFLQKKALEDSVRKVLAEKKVQVEEYSSVVSFLKALPEGKRILLDSRFVSYALYKTLADRHTLIDKMNPTEALKAVKNPVELEHMEEIFLKDSVAVTKFIFWLKSNIGKREITEITAAEHLEEGDTGIHRSVLSHHFRLQGERRYDALRGCAGEPCRAEARGNAARGFRRTVSGRDHGRDAHHCAGACHGGRKASLYGGGGGNAPDDLRPLALWLYRKEP